MKQCVFSQAVFHTFSHGFSWHFNMPFNKQSLHFFFGSSEWAVLKKSMMEPAAGQGKGLNIVMSFLTYTWLLSFELLAFSVCTFIYCLLRHFVKLMRIHKISRKICSHLLLFISIVYLEEYICAKEQKRGWQLLFGQLAMTTQLTFRIPPTSSSHAYKVKVI